MLNAPTHLELWSFEQLVLQQPHARVTGLFRKDDHYFIVVPDLAKTIADDGTELSKWFAHKGKAIGAAVTLTNHVPAGATKVAPRTVEERIMQAGSPKRLRDLLVDLTLSLPRAYPRFVLSKHNRTLQVSFVVDLTPEERALLAATIEALRFPLKYEVVIDPSLDFNRDRFPRAPQGDIDLAPSRALSERLPRELRWRVEEDDDFWSQNRRALLGGDKIDARQMLPKSWQADASRCLVNAATFPAKNLRQYLTVYEQVLLVAPLRSAQSEILSSLNVTEAELIELVKLGRVGLVLPQSIERYQQSLVAPVAEQAPQNLLLSRRLAAATVADTKRRVPLLYAPFTVDERHALLQSAMDEIKKLPPSPHRALAEVLLSQFKRMLNTAEEMLHCRGAMATAGLGLGPLIAAGFEAIAKRDIAIEAWSAAAPVEWAAALRANVVPIETDGYSEVKLTELFAGAYSGVRSDVGLAASQLDLVLGDLLAVDNDADVVGFAKALDGGAIVRLRAVLGELAERNPHPDLLREAVVEFNQEVKAYEKRRDFLRSLQVHGIAGALAAPVVMNDPKKVFVPAGAWLIGQLLVGQWSTNLPFAGRLLDAIRALPARTSADVVFVSRTRKSIADALD